MSSRKSSKKASAHKGGRLHIRTASKQRDAEYHAFAARCGTTITTLVTSYLDTLLADELAASRCVIQDAEQL